MDRSARPIQTHLEGIFRILSGSLLRHSVAVTATCSPPPCYDLASCRTTLPCAIRHPCDFQPWMSLSGDAKPKCLTILAAPLVFEERRGGVVPFWTCAEFSSAQLFYWSHTDSCLDTNKTILPHPPLFFGSFILTCVYKYQYWCCVSWYENVLSLSVYRTLPPFKCIIFPAFNLLPQRLWCSTQTKKLQHTTTCTYIQTYALINMNIG